MTERNDDPALGHTLAGEWHGPAMPKCRPGGEPLLPNAVPVACIEGGRRP
jgi:hypothetical protein